MKEPGFFSDSLPEGVPAELTVSELEEMACRQQQQIESQRQLLAAKEQRLRFLKQHETKHQLVASEHERLRRLRDKVETQEQKLRKLRALRGQVDQTKLNNVSLTSDLESIRSLFNEKEKELSIAVAKVEELTRQLEELQRGRDINSNQKGPSAAAGELEKLRAELMYRNKLNEQHSARLTHQRELIAQRQEEMAAIDRRIAELQERLHRKRLLNQQLAHQINKQQTQDNNNQKVQMQQQHYPQAVNQQNQMMHHTKPSPPLTQLQQKLNQQKLQQMLHLQKQQQHHPQQMPPHQIQTSQPIFNHINATNKNVQQMKNVSSQGMNAVPKPTMSKTTAGINIAAVEPYHHVPSAKSCHNQYGGPIVQQELNKPSHRVMGPANGVMNPSVMGAGTMIYQQQQRLDQRSHYPYPMVQQNQKDSRMHSTDDHRVPVLGSVAAEEDKKSNHELLNAPGEQHKLEDRLHEFWPNKFDPKYQTLPSGTKFSPVASNVSRYDCRRPAEGVETTQTFSGNHEGVTNHTKLNSNDKGIADDSNRFNSSGGSADAADANNSSSNNIMYSPSAENVRNAAGANTSQQQQTFVQQMNIVRSMPIQNNPNKGLATALSNSNQTSKNADNANRSYEAPSFSSHNHVENQSSFPAPAVTPSSTNVTFSSTYQKPVSSVSPIYQTSSTRIQPVQPQVIGSIAVSQNHQNHQQQYQDSRRSYQVNPDSSTNSYQTVNCNGNNNNNNNNGVISKPALPPKPAAPVKITPPPPPRQSAFHVQFAALNENKCPAETRPGSYDYERENVDENLNHEVQSRLTGSDVKETNKSEKKFYGKDTTDADMIDTNSNTVRGMINMSMRNGLVFNKDLPPKIVAESPPPLPSVDPPSDDEMEKSMKMKTIYVQKSNDNDESGANNNDGDNIECGNNDNESKDRSHHVQTIMSDISQDSSSSDTSSNADNNYFVNTSRRIELPPSYLFPEGGQNNEKDVNIILNMKNTIEQINVDTSSENEKSSPTSLSPDSENSKKLNEETQLNDDFKKLRKGNLKNNNSVNSKRRVSFDPLALLLDASLEGELELVIRTAGQVKNPSSANDEGITALHNAICAGHLEIVRFLVQFGCDVNAQDSDGWTPLHCAASCNNLPMVRFLVEHGACIFATTLSDQETAAEKCEEDEEGFDGCSEFLYSIQEKLGILNNGVVYAVFDYEAHNPDELSFKEGDRLTVLRKGDEWEREWWWSRHNDKEGYIPRNLLGLYPRTHPNTNRIQD